MLKKANKNEERRKRHMRIRQRIKGDEARPRLCVYRSNKHIYAQVINDVTGHTLVSASTLDKEAEQAKTWGCDAAKAVGELIAKRAKEKGVEKVVFDRGGYIYHGRVAAVAEAAREAGLEF